MKKNWIKIVLVSVLLIIIFGALPVFNRITLIDINQKEIDNINNNIELTKEKLNNINEYQGEIKNNVQEYFYDLSALIKNGIRSQYEYIIYLGIVTGIGFIILGILAWKKKDEYFNFSMIMNISGVGIIILHIIARIISDI